MPLEVSGTDALLALVALLAGTVDAIAGGGGLLTVPALLAAGLPPHLALGTNKGQSVFGAAAALTRFAREGLVPVDRARWTAPLGFLGSLAGAQLVLWVRPEVLRPVQKYRMVLYSLMLIILMITRPGGLLGSREVSLAGLFRRLRPARGGA